jgi:uncharacterized membrane protein
MLRRADGKLMVDIAPTTLPPSPTRPEVSGEPSGGRHRAETPDQTHVGPGGEERSAPSETTPRSRLRRLSLAGAVLGVAAAWLSVTPSLVPRAWLIQALLTGLCLLSAYAIGAVLGWGYRALHVPALPSTGRRVAWRVIAVVAPVGLVVAGWLGRGWQLDQRALIGMEASVPWTWVVGPLLGVLVAGLLLMVGRGVVWVGRRLSGLLRRLLPARLATTIAVVVTTVAAYAVVSGLLVDTGVSVGDEVFALKNDDSKPGVVNPGSPYRSGGPNSQISWDEMGREGRSFVWSGLTRHQITEVTGDQNAVEPVRAFIGLKSAPTPAARARLAVRELRRLGGFRRHALAIAGGTGSGWIDPKAAAALEYAAHGDVATVSMQYSYLPSWLSYLVDQERAASNAEELIVAVRVALDEMPALDRPKLYVYGESLGAFSTGSAFTSVEDMSTTTDGALLIGPPSFDKTWQRVQENREAGSPPWRPVYRNGALVRVAATAGELTDPALRWQTDNRIVYLVHASDPIVGWTADRGEWLDSRGPGVPPQVRDVPLVGTWQWTFDQFGATGTPPGYGHVYDNVVVTAWSEILGPPSLPAAEIAAISAAVDHIRDRK